MFAMPDAGQWRESFRCFLHEPVRPDGRIPANGDSGNFRCSLLKGSESKGRFPGWLSRFLSVRFRMVTGRGVQYDFRDFRRFAEPDGKTVPKAGPIADVELHVAYPVES